MRKDISTRNDIKIFVSQFYDCLLKDAKIKHFFEHILKEDSLNNHLETITNFWQDILFGTVNYGKNAMKPHFELHKKTPFKQQHFKAWLHHFITTIDQLYSGEKVELAKQRAQSIATIMQVKLHT